MHLQIKKALWKNKKRLIENQSFFVQFFAVPTAQTKIDTAAIAALITNVIKS